LRKFIFACLLLANLNAKSSRTTSEFSGIDEKLSWSIVKLAEGMIFLKRFENQLVLQFECTQKYLKGKDISY
jgi:hypothetical protein